MASRSVTAGARRPLPEAYRVPFGYWEAKDEEDDLDKEIAAKFRRGYPRDNIIFEDSKTAVLVQYGNEVTRCSVNDTDKLRHLLDLFFQYERPEVADFRKAVVQFQVDLPEVLKALRSMIEKALIENPAFQKGAAKFLKHAQETINPAVTAEDVREMLIQHVLTEEIFSKVFDEDDFHRQNNVAKELYSLESLFFTGALKKTTLKGLEPYYNAIRTTAHQIAAHTEKQTFLKVIYEGFYKAYNKKAADRLGVVYTPNAIVKFMVEGTDWLCQKHFDKSLIDRDVQILDPATGTGTFICELLEHFRGQKGKLAHKYKEELHANEVAILPYYVANLNIEATYAAIVGQYEEFPNLCFVDTLDNVGGLGIRAGHQHELFGAVSEENVVRIKRQNQRKISVVIGNPPYNSNQQNENDNNRNRTYPRIDQRIKDTYIELSNAQKTKAYDMYTRFFRWASDRLHDDGVLTFITNRSFIDGRTMDGFRRAMASEYSYIYVLDLGGDIRTNPKLSGPRNNVFGIQTGVAISFFVKRRPRKGAKHTCEIYYARRPEMETSEDKIMFLDSTHLSNLELDRVTPDKSGNWINQANDNFSALLPLATDEAKAEKRPDRKRALFGFFTNGINTARDEWVYDDDNANLSNKVKYLIETYSKERELTSQRKLPLRSAEGLSSSIKWSAGLLSALNASKMIIFDERRIVQSQYRPFVSSKYYADENLSDRLTGNHSAIFGSNLKQPVECIAQAISPGSTVSFPLAVSRPADWHMLSDTRLYPRVYMHGDEKLDIVTDWGLKQFVAHYRASKSTKRPITKDAIFHYVYAILHDPIYREKYAQSLRREFPRIPFYENFWKWAEWGNQLMALHINYETVQPFKLKRVDKPDKRSRDAKMPPKPSLKANKDTGIIVLDTETQLAGIPSEAWTYKLGNRSALEWILDQYKEWTPKDQTIRAKFNAYRFADHKEKVIDLLMRVTRVSVETMEIVAAMKDEKR